MVLAIGVVVDDAIVVVEAVHAKMHENAMTPYAATGGAPRDQRRDHRDHARHGGGVRAGHVHPGPRRQFYRQFGITMATSIILSGVVALTLTPVLCAMILKPHVPGAEVNGEGQIRGG
jgi:HAE1 family hydrophobic/amphiphilic exporter-1